MRVSLLLLCLFLANFCSGVEQLRKPAVLVLPESVECQMDTGISLSGEIGVRWDEPEPLRMSVWQDSKSGGIDRLMADITVFDEAGKEVEQQFFVSLPPMPTGEVIVGRDEHRQFRFFVWNGEVVFRRPGNYYAVATFSDAWTGKMNVQFTTAKRWFRVIEAPPKPKST